MERIKIGLIGCGTVGSSFYRLMSENGDELARKLGVSIAIEKIVVKDLSKVREGVPQEKFSDRYHEIIEDPEVPIVVELVGGVDVAYDIISLALRAGKHVITANKALLALRGAELFRLAREHGVKLMFEASVCGGIPIIKVIRESLIGNRIRRILGIVNGTTNYILTRMTEEGMSFQAALRQAQEQGFAESDPTLDIQGGDAAHKISLLAAFSFGKWIDYRQMLCEGIAGITTGEIEFARSAGFVFKLIASAELIEDRPAVTVFPALLPEHHPLAAVRGVLNAVLLESDYLGSSVYEGRGAGGDPTASSVASDLGDLVKRLVLKSESEIGQIETSKASELYPSDSISYSYFFHFITDNRPGIWAAVTGLLADNGINIESVNQKWEDKSKPSDLYILVDPAEERQARKALAEITASSGISEESRFYRIIHS
jgi:homoserine dehydrogenase